MEPTPPPVQQPPQQPRPQWGVWTLCLLLSPIALLCGLILLVILGPAFGRELKDAAEGAKAIARFIGILK
jgi:hypothetical protein